MCQVSVYIQDRRLFSIWQGQSQLAVYRGNHSINCNDPLFPKNGSLLLDYDIMQSIAICSITNHVTKEWIRLRHNY